MIAALVFVACVAAAGTNAQMNRHLQMTDGYSETFATHRGDFEDRGCNHPLTDTAKFSATSFYGTGKEGQQAKFDSISQEAWSPLQSDHNQFLLIDLQEAKHVLGIMTAGRPNTQHYTQNYSLDYGETLDQMISYTDELNYVKIFEGNNDSISFQRNDFSHPIVARFVRIIPRRWNGMIGLRVELFGCDYATDVVSFDGQSYVKIDLTPMPIIAVAERTHFRFKTVKSEGLMLYSHGFQGDIFVVQMAKSRLLLTIGLGENKMRTVRCGSALDDGMWHSLSVVREERRVEVRLDGVSQLVILEYGYYKMNLDSAYYVGGIDNLQKPFVIARQNFEGCFERLWLNNTNVIFQMKSLERVLPTRFDRVGNIYYSCPDYRLDVLTFTSNDAFLRLPSLVEQNTMNISFCFRTYDSRGLLLVKDLVDYGFVKVLIDRERLKLRIRARDIPELLVNAFPKTDVSDGMWHCYALLIRINTIVQTLDGKLSTTKRLLALKPKYEYLFGANMEKDRDHDGGFRGCLRNILTEGIMWDLQRLAGERSSFVVLNECRMRDACTPDPCRHGGRCHQTWEQFHCDCTGTGYGGAVCKASSHPLSCEDYRRYHPQSREALVSIDVDGSGFLPPFYVNCVFHSDRRTETHLHHDTMEETAVDGFQLPGSYVQRINYNASWNHITALVNQSHVCRQHMKYSCLNAKLLNTPRGPPYGFWLSRASRQMVNWAGGLPGIPICACGLTESCYDRTRGCNCDADDDPLRQEYLVDEGWFEPKDFLPVRQLAFGDTGSGTDNKRSKYHLGPLICEGNHLMDNIVTFWRQDATVVFPQVRLGEDVDIYFQFKTTVESGTFLHAKGQQDAVRISLLSPTEVQFMYETGNGPKTVNAQSSNYLNDNQWHSVLVERNRLEARIRVDGSLGGELKTMGDVYRPFEMFVELMVGADVDLSGGYVGCLRTLMVNGVSFNLRHFVQLGAYGMVGGCVGRCDSSPCFNGGVCRERYDQYDCDCRFTAFRGPLCSDEIGAHFRPEDSVLYDLQENQISTVAEKIHVGFVTTEKRGILMQVTGASGDYLTVEISNAGTIRVAFDLGFERQELYEESQDYTDGQFHDVRIWRTNGGRKLSIQVDDYDVLTETYTIETKQDSQLNSIRTIYLGRNYSMNGREGFLGCLSRVSFEDYFILKLLFQQNPPSNVKSNRRLREDWCNVEPATHPPEVVPQRPDIIRVPYPPPPLEAGSQSANSDYEIFMAVLLGVLVIVIVAGGLLAARLHRKRSGRSHRQDREDQEEDEAEEVRRASTGLTDQTLLATAASMPLLDEPVEGSTDF